MTERVGYIRGDSNSFSGQTVASVPPREAVPGLSRPSGPMCPAAPWSQVPVLTSVCAGVNSCHELHNQIRREAAPLTTNSKHKNI